MVLQGISGINIGDGAGGNVALSITTNVLRILGDTEFSYMTATIKNPGEVKAGTVTYYVPELIGSQDYGASGTQAFDIPQAGITSININSRRNVKMSYETFDVERLNNSDYLIGMVETSISMAIQADLNGQFLTYLKSQFEAGGALAAQTITLTQIPKKNVAMTPELARQDYLTMEYLVADLSTQFDKLMIGVNKAEIHSILSPYCDIGIRNAFWNQPNMLGEFVISPTLSGRMLGNVKYTVDKMLDKNIPAGSSFSKDQAVNLTGYAGFTFHNEAIAMPFNLQQIGIVQDPENLNPRFIAKYQFGIGILRPKLVWALKRDTTKAEIKEVEKLNETSIRELNSK